MKIIIHVCMCVYVCVCWSFLWIELAFPEDTDIVTMIYV